MLHLKVLSPEKVIIDEQNLDYVTIYTLEGEVTIYPGHLPYISEIDNGYIKYKNEKILIEKAIVVLKENTISILKK